MLNTVMDTAESIATSVKETGASALASGKVVVGMRTDPIEFDSKNVGAAVNSAHSFLHKTLLGAGFKTAIADAELAAAEKEMTAVTERLEKATQPAKVEEATATA